MTLAGGQFKCISGAAITLSWSHWNVLFCNCLRKIITVRDATNSLQRGMNRGMQIRRSVPFFRQIRQSANLFVQIRKVNVNATVTT